MISAILPFDLAQMLQISKFSVFWNWSLTFDFLVSTWPNPLSEGPNLISRIIGNFQC
jgi:hypothetical protein